MNMSGQNQLLHLIYLRPGGMLVSKKRYSGWRAIQDDYEYYLTSLGPFSEDGLLEFLAGEYGADAARWGLSSAEVRAFMESDAEVLESRDWGR